jgi:hypothetical protein
LILNTDRASQRQGEKQRGWTGLLVTLELPTRQKKLKWGLVEGA